MRICICDEFANCDEIEIHRTADSIYIDIPKKKSGETVLKLLKLILIYIRK